LYGGVGEGQRPGADQVDQAATEQPTGRSRMSVPEAAEAFGITADAVRSRIKRGTLPTVREGGRVFVLMGSATTDQPIAQAQPTNRPGEDRLYQEMQSRIRYLEHQVEEEREARRRADTLLARLMDRMPELEAPAETPGVPETAAEEPERSEPRSSAGVAEEGAQERRGFWSRLFGS
jgi:hypothetical protein